MVQPQGLAGLATQSELEAAMQAAGQPLPEGPSTQYLRTLVPKTIPLVVFGTRVLKYWLLGPSGSVRRLHKSEWIRTRY